MPDPEPTAQTEKRELYCALTQPEFNVRAVEFAKLDDELDSLQVAKKAAGEDFKDRIGGVKARRAVLRRVVTERREKREVPCTWHADWASKSMLLRRDDTGEVVEARTMTGAEVQRGFDFTPDDKQLPEKGEDGETLNG
jgi:hypothetical protein